MRQRSSDYYLEKIGGSQAALYADNTVGELEQREFEETIMIPTRVEGRERPHTRTVNRLVQVAVHDSLADYMASRKTDEHNSEHTLDSTDWTLDDIPPEVVAKYEEWRDNYDGPSIDEIRKSAKSLVADKTDLDRLSPCPYCRTDSKYACYVCGYSREFYDYPLVRFDTGSKTMDEPFDLARIVELNPEAIALEDKYYIQNQRLHAKRTLSFHADKVSAGQFARINDSDRLSQGAEVVLDHWTEDGNSAKRQAGSHRPMSFKDKTPATPEDYIKLMQKHISQFLTQERPGSEEREKKYQKLLKKVGSLGCALTFKYVYAGMGETDARFELVDPKDNFASRAILSSSGDVEFSVEDSLATFDRRDAK